MHGRGPWILAAGALVVVGLAGCSGGSGGSANSGGTHAVAPGHDTPQDAADGLIQAELAKNQQEACNYFVPSQQAACRAQQPQLPSGGQVSVVKAVTSGDQALVAITGKVCLTSSECQTSTDPTIGMPTASVTFAQAYQKALSGAVSFTPVPCIKVNGQWYVNNQPSN